MSTPNILLIKRRASDSLLGTTLPVLSSGELAFNEVNNVLYYAASAGVIDIGGPGAYTRLTVTNSVTSSLLTTIQTVSTELSNGNSGLKTYVDTTFLPLSGGSVFGEVTLQKGFSALDSAYVSGNLLITGNLSALGDVTYLDTKIISTSAVQITNIGTGPALIVTQEGPQDIATFYDDANTALIIKDGGNIGINTGTPNEKLTVLGNISASNDLYGRNASFTGSIEAQSISINGNTFVDSSQNITALGTLSVDNGQITSNGSGTLTVANSLYGTINVSTIEGFVIDGGSF
jgi:hypothetical protein